MQGELNGKTVSVVCASFVLFSLKSSTQLYNHYRIIVGENLVKYVSGVRRMNEVNPRRARLVLGWVTVFGRVYHLGM